MSYDILEEVVGVRGENSGSLMDFGVNYHAIPLTNTNEIDLLNKSINEQTKMIAISDQKDMPTLLHSQCGYIKI